ncbi:hypothetical protein BC835DRAFT_1310559 [Cytidiella melzeri]|nr:hypothetical protein BC835DRAFT_1310559 [Cytidiella melzeri]
MPKKRKWNFKNLGSHAVPTKKPKKAKLDDENKENESPSYQTFTSPSKSTYNGLEHDIYDTTSPHTWYSPFAPAGSSSLELENAPSTAVNFDEAPISLQDEDDDCGWLDDPDEERKVTTRK